MLARHIKKNDERHMKLARHLVRYVKGVKSVGITITKIPKAQLHRMHAFADATWADDMKDRKSTTGFVIFLGPPGCNPIAFGSKKQTSIAMSSTESELIAYSDTAMNISYFRRLLSELTFEQEPTHLYADNQAAMQLGSGTATPSRRSRHIELRYLKTREMQANRQIKYYYIGTKDQVADSLTKNLDKTTFRRHLEVLHGIQEWKPERPPTDQI
jgi:hypothetical protein